MLQNSVLKFLALKHIVSTFIVIYVNGVLRIESILLKTYVIVPKYVYLLLYLYISLSLYLVPRYLIILKRTNIRNQFCQKIL